MGLLAAPTCSLVPELSILEDEIGTRAAFVNDRLLPLA